MAEDAARWMQEAATVAQKSLCLRGKRGAVIVKNGKIVGQGYNAPPQDNLKWRRCPDGDPCCVHAEQRAIMDALRTHPNDIVGSVLYYVRLAEDGTIARSGKPSCTVCSRLSLDVGIAEFVLWHTEGITVYPTDEYNELSMQNK